MQVVWYENRALIFTPTSVGDGVPEFRATGNADLTPANLLQKFDNSNMLRIVSDEPESVFERFAGQMRRVEAAGGIVENANGEVLMIHRRGWWDLPKGHVEPGETTEEAALREVSEETGLHSLEIVTPLMTTQHFYDTYGEWEMKRTWWYLMRETTPGIPHPQSEEEITDVRWLSGKELWTRVGQTYGTIREVFSKWIETK